MNRGGLKRRAPLRPRSERKASMPRWRTEMVRQRTAREDERDAERYARQWGCEYSTEFLTLWREVCPLCERWCPPFERHHLKRRSAGGVAEDIVVVCQKCHGRIHGTRPASSSPIPEEELRPIANLIAAQAKALGYLPVERCDLCGVWHSAKYMVNLIEPGQPSRRACTSLGWYARKAKAGTLPCVVDVLP